MDGDPNINVSASTVIITPKLEIITESACDEGLVQITTTSNTDEVLWYETPSSSEVINSGLIYETFINSTTTFWLSAIFNGCEGGGRIPVTVDVYPSPIANDITIIQCDDEETDGLSYFNLDYYKDDIIRDSDGQVNSSWDVSFFEDDLFQNEITLSMYMNTSNYQVIYAQVLDASTGCLSTSEVTLQINESEASSASLNVCDDYEVDGYTLFNLSEADDQILTYSPVNASISYYVTHNEALLNINEITGNYLNEVPFSQIIYARVDIGNTCYAINEVVLTVKDIPNVSQYQEVYYCLNSFPETITLEGGIIDGVPNNYYYNWSTEETTFNIEVNEIGTYNVYITEPNGCTNLRTVNVIPSSTAIIEAIEISGISENNEITILVSGEGDYVYALDNENGIYQESNVFDNVPSGIHTVYVKDIKADCGIVSEDISVLGFPKFFTPNGDSENDTWQVSGFSSQFPITASVEIFDRYGKLLTVINENNPKWDGTHNGRLLTTNDYWFIAKLVDGRTYKGHFTLKR